MRNLILFGLGAGLLISCGDDGRNPPVQGSDAGPRPDAAPPNFADAGGVTPDGAVDPEGPVVVVTSPTAPSAGDLSSGAIVTSRNLTATCTAQPNASTLEIVDPTSVVIEVIGGAGGSVSAQAVPTANPNEYSASLNIGTFANGAITVRCTASDVAERANSDDVATLLDLGPSVTIFSPIADQSYGGSVALSFTVLPDPIAPSDSGAAVGTVTARVAGQAVTLTSPSTNVYSGVVDFDAPAFSPELEGPLQIEISAANTRSGTPVTRVSRVSFVADNDGPAVTITSPTAGQLVSGVISIEANVQDDAGVTAVTATINAFEVELTKVGNSWVGLFDTRVLIGIYPLLQVRAIDSVGNERSAGQVIALDNQPPVLDLDPVPVREAICVNVAGECDSTDIYECSRQFDPLGIDAVNDGETVPQLSELRLRTEDRANAGLATSGVAVPIANVNTAAVDLLVLDNVDLPLVIDTNMDGLCDAINPAVVPALVPMASNEAALVNLAQAGLSGSSNFSPTAVPFGTTSGLGDDACLDPLEDVVGPQPLCLFSNATRHIAASHNKTISAIYGVPPITANSCSGNAFDSLASNTDDGWACVAAVAEDNLGNIGVSAPLRVCFDFDGDGEDGSGTALSAQGCETLGSIAVEGNRPSCTDGCDPSGLRFSAYPGRNILYLNTQVRECADGIDNDLDGLVDVADDSCDDYNDADE